MKIAVAVSGGMDSTYALLRLKEEGHEVMALHARFLPAVPGSDPVPGLEKLCARHGLPLAVADLREEFESLVMAPFAQMYRQGRTPNPCALCNRAMKFGRLRRYAMEEMGAEALATGHYAAVERHPVYGPALRAGADQGKDQSYFLALVPAPALLGSFFPLAEQAKSHIRAWLGERGIPVPLPSESQEICFVPGDHRDFLKARWAEAAPPGGDVLFQDEDGSLRKIAVHEGLWQYTEGQRKGLGIAWRAPLFVLRKDKERNALIVGEKNRLHAREAVAGQVNLLAAPDLWPGQIYARLRYRQRPAPVVARLEDEKLFLSFPEDHDPPASGQIAALYDARGFLLAGAVLE